MKPVLICTLFVAALAKPNGFYHQEYNYRTSSSSYKNHELQHRNDDEGYYSKDGDLEGRFRPRVDAHSQHSEYVNPKLQHGYRLGTDRTSSFGQLNAQDRFRLAEPGLEQNVGGGFGYVGAQGYGISSDLRQVTARLQQEIERELQNAVYEHYQRAAAYGGSITQAQIEADRRSLEEELRRNMTMRLQEALKVQYGNQGIRGAYSYSIVNGRLQPTANYNNQELADLTRQMEENLLRHLNQQVQTHYRTRVDTQVHTQRNTYRQVQGIEDNYPSNLEHRPVYRPYVQPQPLQPMQPIQPVQPLPPQPHPVAPIPDSITTVATRVQTELNENLNKILEDTQRRYFSENSFQAGVDYDRILVQLQNELRANISFHFDDQIKRAYGYTNYASKYSVEDIENLRRQIETNLITKLNRDFSRQREKFFQSRRMYVVQPIPSNLQPIPSHLQPSNQVYYPVNVNYNRDLAEMQRQLQEQMSRQLQMALSQQSYRQAHLYSGAASSFNPQAHYQATLEQLAAELNRNLTRQMESLNIQQSQSAAYASQLANMRNQLQNDLMRQLQQGLQQSYSRYSSWSASSSSSSSSSANYRPVRGYDPNLHRYPVNSGSVVAGEDCMMGDDPSAYQQHTDSGEDLTQQVEDLTQQNQDADLTQQTEDLTQQAQDLTQQTQDHDDLTQQVEDLTQQAQDHDDLTQQVQTHDALTQQSQDDALTQQTEDLTQQVQDLTQQTQNVDDWKPQQTRPGYSRPRPISQDLTQQTQQSQDDALTQQTEDLTQQVQDLTQQTQNVDGWKPQQTRPGYSRPRPTSQDLTQQTQDLTQQSENRDQHQSVSIVGPPAEADAPPPVITEYREVQPVRQTLDQVPEQVQVVRGPPANANVPPVQSYEPTVQQGQPVQPQQTTDDVEPIYHRQTANQLYSRPQQRPEVPVQTQTQTITYVRPSPNRVDGYREQYFTQPTVDTPYQQTVVYRGNRYRTAEYRRYYESPRQYTTQYTWTSRQQIPSNRVAQRVEYYENLQRPRNPSAQQTSWTSQQQQQQIGQQTEDVGLGQTQNSLGQQTDDALTQQVQKPGFGKLIIGDQHQSRQTQGQQVENFDQQVQQSQGLTQQNQDLTQQTQDEVFVPLNPSNRDKDSSNYRPSSPSKPGQVESLNQQLQDNKLAPLAQQQAQLFTDQQNQDLTQQSQDLTQQSQDLTQQSEDLTQQSQDLTQQSQNGEFAPLQLGSGSQISRYRPWSGRRPGQVESLDQQTDDNKLAPQTPQQTQGFSGQQNQDLTQQSQDLTQQIEDLTQQNQHLSQQTQDLPQQNQDLTQQSQDLTQQNQYLTKQTQDLTQQNQALSQQNQQTEDLSQQTQDSTQQHQDLTQQTQDLTQQSEDLTQPQRGDYLTQQIQDLTQQTEDINQPIEPQISSNKIFKDEPSRQQLAQQTQDLIQQEVSHNQQLAQQPNPYLTRQNQHLTQQTGDLTQQTEDLTQQSQDLTQQSQDLTQQTEDLSQQSQDLSQQSQDLTQHSQDLTQQTEDLTQQNQDLTQQTENLTQQNQDLTQQTEDQQINQNEDQVTNVNANQQTDDQRLSDADRESQRLIDLIRNQQRIQQQNQQSQQNHNIGPVHYSPRPVYADYNGHPVQVGTTRVIQPNQQASGYGSPVSQDPAPIQPNQYRSPPAYSSTYGQQHQVGETKQLPNGRTVDEENYPKIQVGEPIYIETVEDRQPVQPNQYKSRPVYTNTYGQQHQVGTTRHLPNVPGHEVNYATVEDGEPRDVETVEDIQPIQPQVASEVQQVDGPQAPIQPQVNGAAAPINSEDAEVISTTQKPGWWSRITSGIKNKIG